MFSNIFGRGNGPGQVAGPGDQAAQDVRAGNDYDEELLRLEEEELQAKLRLIELRKQRLTNAKNASKSALSPLATHGRSVSGSDVPLSRGDNGSRPSLASQRRHESSSSHVDRLGPWLAQTRDYEEDDLSSDRSPVRSTSPSVAPTVESMTTVDSSQKSEYPQRHPSNSHSMSGYGHQRMRSVADRQPYQEGRTERPAHRSISTRVPHPPTPPARPASPHKPPRTSTSSDEAFQDAPERKSSRPASIVPASFASEATTGVGENMPGQAAEKRTSRFQQHIEEEEEEEDDDYDLQMHETHALLQSQLRGHGSFVAMPQRMPSVRKTSAEIVPPSSPTRAPPPIPSMNREIASQPQAPPSKRPPPPPPPPIITTQKEEALETVETEEMYEASPDLRRQISVRSYAERDEILGRRSSHEEAQDERVEEIEEEEDKEEEEEEVQEEKVEQLGPPPLSRTPSPNAPRPRPPIPQTPVPDQESSSDEELDAEFDENDRCSCGKAHVQKDKCFFCWPCNGAIFCDFCWDICPPHKKRKLGFSRQVGLPHEKSDPVVGRKIFETLQAERDLEQQALMHEQDEDTSWFGTGKDDSTGETVFQDFGRYSRLMEAHSTQRRRLRFPALVSFVGQTGAGKSSLIRLLVETLSPEEATPQVPVVGSSLHADLPTSGDVHLYADLSTFEGDQPILYADCEGLDGGEREPMGARKRKGKQGLGSNYRTQSFTKHIRKQHHTSEREIVWADTPLKSSREYHVRHLYPRLLFTFSDVIVFVLRNVRTIENTIEQLINWAAAALESSSNQPVLPHAIIVLNAYDNASDPNLWDVDNSTIDLMEKVSRAVHQNHHMRKFAEFWREKGRQIESVETLLLSYYSSVRVVRMPERGRPTLINEQVKRLYQEIVDATEKSRQSKHKLRMLLNSDELQPYLQHAFDHFCRNLERPFDFVQASLAFHPIPSNFGGNILKMAIDIMNVWKNRIDGPSIFKELSFIVASCIMLDSARRRTLGTAEKVFGAYVQHIDEVLETFCNLHWPCEYVHPLTLGRCVNVQAGHQSKGHQLSNGKVIAVGQYQSDFTAERYREFFEYCVVFNLRDLLRQLHDATHDSLHVSNLELEKAAEIHRDVVLRPFYRHLSGSKLFVNHTACYCCLISSPTHPLPCGHVLCTDCTQTFGKARGPSLVEMTYCPLHSNGEDDGEFRIRWPIFIKPTGAGTRILSLDGGGVRGIVELTILSEIERQLGVGLPIQAFFDLIVGTSTGGIIALGLGANGWTVARCTQEFKKLCKKAFVKRWGVGLPGLEHLISLSNHSRYETTPLEAALQTVFGAEQPLFGGSRDVLDNESVLQRITKVAVTTATTAGTVALLANYNRSDENEDNTYDFHRCEGPESEIKTWEAARATSAAPTMFKPFAHTPTGQVYQDGAIYYNCPVELALKEQRLIWPDTAERGPDIVLSVGTGYNINSRKPLAAAERKAPRFGLFSGSRMLYKMAVDHIMSSLNSENTWRKFMENRDIPEYTKSRYQRLNLRMQKDPPRMDETAMLGELEEMTHSQFVKERHNIKAIADRLIASAFYFSLEQEVMFPSNRFQDVDAGPRAICGRLQCRFAPYSTEIRSLGEALRRRSRNAYNRPVDGAEHNPYFVVRERRDERNAKQVVMAPAVVDKMITDGSFAMERITVKLSSRRAETEMLFCLGDQPQRTVLYPISGFPRCFLEELTPAPKIQRDGTRQTRNPQAFKMNWADLETKKSAWKFAAAQFLKTGSPFQHFSSAEYVNPGDAEADFLDSLKMKFNSGENIDGLAGPGGRALHEVAELDSLIAGSTGVNILSPTGDGSSDGEPDEDEVLRRQMLRLLFTSGSYVAGPPSEVLVPVKGNYANTRLSIAPHRRSDPPRQQAQGVFELDAAKPSPAELPGSQPGEFYGGDDWGDDYDDGDDTVGLFEGIWGRGKKGEKKGGKKGGKSARYA